MTPDVKSRIEDEIRRFATDLNLSDPQKAQLRTAFENGETKLDEGTPFQKVRDSIGNAQIRDPETLLFALTSEKHPILRSIRY
jgi:hypothetical protein